NLHFLNGLFKFLGLQPLLIPASCFGGVDSARGSRCAPSLPAWMHARPGRGAPAAGANQAASARRRSTRAVILSIRVCGGTTKLASGSFSAALALCAGSVSGADAAAAGSSARVDHMLLSIAVVADHVETRTPAVSKPDVNNLRINRSCSTAARG